MTKIITLFLGVCLSIPSLSQYSQSFSPTIKLDSIRKKELRLLLLNQTISPKASELVKKNNNGRKIAYTCLGVSALITTLNAASIDVDKDDPAPVIGIIIGGGSFLLLATVTGIIADSRLQKAKRYYLEAASMQSSIEKRRKAIDILKER